MHWIHGRRARTTHFASTQPRPLVAPSSILVHLTLLKEGYVTFCLGCYFGWQIYTLLSISSMSCISIITYAPFLIQYNVRFWCILHASLAFLSAFAFVHCLLLLCMWSICNFFGFCLKLWPSCGACNLPQYFNNYILTSGVSVLPDLFFER